LETADQGMVFTISGGMQQPGEKIRNSKRNRRKQSVKFPHIASFRILNSSSLEILQILTGGYEDDNGNKDPAFAAKQCLNSRRVILSVKNMISSSTETCYSQPRL
jgi:hypothetical protein